MRIIICIAILLNLQTVKEQNNLLGLLNDIMAMQRANNKAMDSLIAKYDLRLLSSTSDPLQRAATIVYGNPSFGYDTTRTVMEIGLHVDTVDFTNITIPIKTIELKTYSYYIYNGLAKEYGKTGHPASESLWGELENTSTKPRYYIIRFTRGPR